jgi:hypothetical protein
MSAGETGLSLFFRPIYALGVFKLILGKTFLAEGLRLLYYFALSSLNKLSLLEASSSVPGVFYNFGVGRLKVLES